MTATAPRVGDTDTPTAPRSPLAGTSGRTVLALAVVAAACFAFAVPSLDQSGASEIGLLATASPTFAISIGLMALAFLIAVRAGHVGLAAGTAVATLLIERLPSLVGTSAPMYAWTYKHLGVVDYIQQYHEVHKNIDVYQGWPGMFAAVAWFSDVTGVSPQTVAHTFTPIFHLGVFALVYVFATQRGLDRMQALVAAFVVETLNWVAQDYFSPQATAFFLALGVLVLIAPEQLSTRRALAALAVFAAISVSHQLTPYWLVAIVVLLALTKRLRPWWLPVAMVLITVAMLLYNFDTVSNFTLFSSDPVSNAQSSVTTVGVEGQRITSLVMRVVTVGFWLLALAAVVLRWRRKQPWWSAAVIAFSSFAILAGQSYGGEAIYRVFLYSLPGCALLVAPLLTRLLTSRIRFGALGIVGLATVVLAAAQGTFGNWDADRVPAADAAAARRLLDSAPEDAYLTPAAPAWPNSMTSRYVTFGGQSSGETDGTGGSTLIRAAGLTGSHLSSDADYEKVVAAIRERTQGPTYLFVSRQMAIYSWYFGYLPLDALGNLTDRMEQDARWRVWSKGDGYVIFRTTAAMYEQP